MAPTSAASVVPATTVKPRIRRLGRTRFLIESRTRPGLGHQVDTLRLTCSCEAGKRGRRCWHLVWSLQAEQWLQRAEAAYQAHNASSSAQRPRSRTAMHEAWA